VPWGLVSSNSEGQLEAPTAAEAADLGKAVCDLVHYISPAFDSLSLMISLK
jgi:hypothetical protein